MGAPEASHLFKPIDEFSNGGFSFVVFSFAKPEDAEAFAGRFGGNVADEQPTVTLKTSGRPERVVQDKRKVENVSSYRRMRPKDNATTKPPTWSESVEWPRGLSPRGSPRTVHEPLDSYGSRCSAVSMT
jgi:hypothetical protein